MKDYSLLLNQTYLYLKQHPTNKPNFSQIAKKIGITRQTIAKEYAKIKEEDWDKFDIKDFHEDIDNKYKRALRIISDLDNKCYNLRELSEMLKISSETLSDYYSIIEHKKEDKKEDKKDKEEDKKEDCFSAVYGCFYQGKLIYVGSTENYRKRVQSHLNNINSSPMKLYSYLKDKDINDIEFKPFITKINIIEYKELEKNLIRFLKPECNVEFL